MSGLFSYKKPDPSCPHCKGSPGIMVRPHPEGGTVRVRCVCTDEEFKAAFPTKVDHGTK